MKQVQIFAEVIKIYCPVAGFSSECIILLIVCPAAGRTYINKNHNDHFNVVYRTQTTLFHDCTNLYNLEAKCSKSVMGCIQICTPSRANE